MSPGEPVGGAIPLGVSRQRRTCTAPALGPRSGPSAGGLWCPNASALVSSRSHILLARRRPDVDPSAIADGRVLVDGRVLANPRAHVRLDASLRVVAERRLRGEVKLAARAGRVVGRRRRTRRGGHRRQRRRLHDCVARARCTSRLRGGSGRRSAARPPPQPPASREPRRQQPRPDRSQSTVPESVEVITMDVSYLAVGRRDTAARTPRHRRRRRSRRAS